MIIISLIYIIKLFIISSAVGCLFIQHGGSSLRKTTLFFTGASLTPFVIGSTTVILSLVNRGNLHVYFFNYLLVGLSLIYLVRTFHKEILPPCRAVISWISISSVILLFLLSLVLIYVISDNFIQQIRIPLTNHDSLVYANEAGHFAEKRTFDAIPDFRDQDRFSASHPHGFLYQAYLADAVLHQKSTSPVEDFPVRIAFQATLVFLLCAIIALSSLYGNLMVIIGSITFSLFHYWMQYVSYASSRDAFRVIPILLLITVLGYSFYADSDTVRSKRFFLFNMFLLFASVQGHTINIVLVPLIYCVWLVGYVRNGISITTISGFLLPAILGGMFGLLHYLKSYLDTGNLMGYGFYYYAYYNTPLWDYQLTLDYFNTTTLSILDKVMHYYRFDDNFSVSFLSSRFLFLCGLLINGAAIIRNCRTKDRAYKIFIPLVLMILFIPNTGLFDFTTLGLSKMLIVNKRYFLHWYILAAVSISIFLFSKSQQRQLPFHALDEYLENKACGNKSLPLLPIIILVGAVYVSATIVHNWYKLPVIERIQNNPLLRAREFIDGLPDNSVLLIDHLGVDYYTSHDTSFIYSRRNWPLFKMDDDKDILKHLKENEINYVVLSLGMEEWWLHTQFGKFLSDDRYAREIYSFRKWRIFQISGTAKR